MNTPTACTYIHQDPPSPNYCSSKMKKSTFNKGSTVRKSGKKDRHSKINTAQGLRDRRMRLSLQIARQFFDLQDMLGFDKASKTIDWLFSKSNKAIKELSCSSSHVIQMNDDNICRKDSKLGEKSKEKRKVITASGGDCVSGVKTPPKSFTSRSADHIAKELRDKARARARERTRGKMMNRCLEESKCNLSDHQAYLAKLGPAENPNPLFEICQESVSNSSSQDDILATQSSTHRQLANMELLGATASLSGSVSCSIYGHHEKNGDIFSGGLDSYFNNFWYLGNWDMS